MKYCSNCGNAMQDNMNFCNCCGASANAPEAQKANEQKCLDRLSTALKHEKLCYKIGGIAYTILGALVIVASIILLLCGYMVLENTPDYIIEYDDYGNYQYYHYYDEDPYVTGEAVAGALFAGLGSGYLFMGVMFLGIGIVNLVLSNKLGKYRSKLYDDCTAGVKHASSVGSIVLAAFFNSVALVFVIINFVFMKKNTATFENIKTTQQNFNSQI